MSELTVQLLFGVASTAPVDSARHGGAVVDVGVIAVEVNGQSWRVAVELALGVLLLGGVRDVLHVHEVVALQAFVDGPLLDLAVKTDADQEFALVLVVDPLHFGHGVGVRAGHVWIFTREDIPWTAYFFILLAHILHFHSTVQLADGKNLRFKWWEIDSHNTTFGSDDILRQFRVFQRVNQHSTFVFEVVRFVFWCFPFVLELARSVFA